VVKQSNMRTVSQKRTSLSIVKFHDGVDGPTCHFSPWQLTEGSSKLSQPYLKHSLTDVLLPVARGTRKKSITSDVNCLYGVTCEILKTYVVLESSVRTVATWIRYVSDIPLGIVPFGRLPCVDNDLTER